MNASLFRSLQRFAFFMRGGEDCELLRQYYVEKDGREKGLENKPVGHPLFVFEFLFSFVLFFFYAIQRDSLSSSLSLEKEERRKKKEKAFVVSCLVMPCSFPQGHQFSRLTPLVLKTEFYLTVIIIICLLSLHTVFLCLPRTFFFWLLMLSCFRFYII